MSKNYDLIKEQLNKIRLLENKNSVVLDNNIELIYTGSVNDKAQLAQIMNGLADVIQGRASDILITVKSDWFTISVRLNFGGQYVEFLMDSKTGEIKMFMDTGEVVYVNGDLLNVLSGINRFFNQQTIMGIRKILI